MDSLQYRRNVERFLDALSSETLAHLFPGAEREEIEDAFGLGETGQTNYYLYQTPDAWSHGKGGTTSFMQALTVEPRKREPESRYSTDFGNGEVDYLSMLISGSGSTVHPGGDASGASGGSCLEVDMEERAMYESAESLGKYFGIPTEDVLKAIRLKAEDMRKEGRLRRLHIDENGKIILKGIEDMGIEDVEIHLKRSEKAFYFLYLNHPEGINYNEFSKPGDNKYRKELEAIYATLYNRSDNEEIEKCLNNICDSESVRRNQYSSTIYGQFSKATNPEYAKNYSVVGKKSRDTKARGEDRLIPIDRNLVTYKFVLRY